MEIFKYNMTERHLVTQNTAQPLVTAQARVSALFQHKYLDFSKS